MLSIVETYFLNIINFFAQNLVVFPSFTIWISFKSLNLITVSDTIFWILNTSQITRSVTIWTLAVFIWYWSTQITIFQTFRCFSTEFLAVYNWHSERRKLNWLLSCCEDRNESFGTFFVLVEYLYINYKGLGPLIFQT